ncbi:unannotated protein [freshwater metagenome]|uniref:Unannotated protein n=1 Tax=freshwater metagenome TaxID=449393 RepID=A0A6J7HLY4_9ZZZZ
MRIGGISSVHELVEDITAACTIKGDDYELGGLLARCEPGDIKGRLWLIFGGNSATISGHCEVNVGVTRWLLGGSPIGAGFGWLTRVWGVAGAGLARGSTQTTCCGLVA